MILEGLVTTIDAQGQPHLAPMGPRVDPSMARLLLRPFPTSQTFRNLKAHGEGVLHVTDDVELLARGAVGAIRDLPPLQPASQVRGWVLTDACRAYEFRVTTLDETGERMALDAEVLQAHRFRDFFGFNRGKHAVVEAAILATRTHLLPAAEIAAEFDRLAVLVEKTGGPAEHRAFAFLREHIARRREDRPA